MSSSAGKAEEVVEKCVERDNQNDVKHDEEVVDVLTKGCECKNGDAEGEGEECGGDNDDAEEREDENGCNRVCGKGECVDDVAGPVSGKDDVASPGKDDVEDSSKDDVDGSDKDDASESSAKDGASESSADAEDKCDVFDSGSDVTFPEIGDTIVYDNDDVIDSSEEKQAEDVSDSEESDDDDDDVEQDEDNLWSHFVGSFADDDTAKAAEKEPELKDDNESRVTQKRRLESYYDQQTSQKRWRSNTLDQAREEWNAYKEKNQVEAEEMEDHNKSKAAYLDRVAFLTRAKEREDELEQEARAEAAQKRFLQQNKKD